MKLRKRDYIKTLFDIFVGQKAREASKKVRYAVELGGKNGYEINGVANYWGRYGSIDKIVELASSLEDDEFEFYFPAKQYDFKYSHRIGIEGIKGTTDIEIEYLEASSQCGAFYKVLPITELKKELYRLNDITDEPEKYGYIYKDWSDVQN